MKAEQLERYKPLNDRLIELMVEFLNRTDGLSNEDFMEKFQFHRRTITRQIKSNTKISKKYFLPILNHLYPKRSREDLKVILSIDVWEFVFNSPTRSRITCIKLAPNDVQLNRDLARIYNMCQEGVSMIEGRDIFGEGFLGMVSLLERYNLLTKSPLGDGKWFSVDFREEHPILFELWKSNFGK